MNITASMPEHAGEVLSYTNERTFIDSDSDTIPAQTVFSVVLGEDGAGTKNLPTPADPDTGARYRVTVGGRYSVGTVVVSTNGPDTLAELLDAEGIDVAAASLLAVRVTALEDAVQGAGIADRTYRHVQSSAASVWTVTHNLGKYPTVAVVDSTRRVVYGQIDYIDTNALTITFSAAFSGEVYAN